MSKKCKQNKKVYQKKYQKKYQASLTVETALVLPVFIIAVISIFDFYVIINYHNIIQKHVNYAAQSVGRYTYALEHMNNKKVNTDENSGSNGYSSSYLQSSSGIDREVLVSGISTAYVLKKILSNEVREYATKAGVYGGAGGISILESSVGGKDGVSDIKVSYAVHMGISRQQSIVLANRCYFRAWIGESIKESDNALSKERIVYVTKTGKVYHYKNTCPYIKIIATAVRFDRISEYRNVNKSRYKPCKACVKGGLNNSAMVYITSDGTRYHYDNRCSKIKREVSTVELSKVGDKRPCSKCGGD